MDLEFLEKKKVRKWSVLAGIGMAVILFIIMLLTIDDFLIISLIPILGFIYAFALIQLVCFILKKMIKVSLGNITVQSANVFKDSFVDL